MAVKYWAEIVRETPAAKNLCNEQVFYAVRVFKGDTNDPSIEFQLGSFKRIELDGSDSRRAVVTTKNVKDLTEGAVIVTEDPFRKPLDRDYFKVSFTSSKPATYTPQFTIKVYEPFQSILPGVSNASTSQLRASTEQADINNGAVRVSIIAPRQNNTFNWGQLGYNPAKWQTVTIPTIQFTKAPVTPDRADAIAESASSTIDGWTWDECTGKRWVGVFASYRYVLTKSPYTVATFDATKNSPNVDGAYSKQIKYRVQALSQADLKAYPDATFAEHKTAGRVRVIWTASGWDWASTGKAFVDPKITKTGISAQSYKNEAIATRKKFSVKICTGGGGGGGGAGDNTPPPQKTPESVKKANNFNPYPHTATRNFAARINEEAIEYEKTNPYDQLAYFYVDPDVVSLPDKKQNEIANVGAAQLEKLWGFRFLFNPSYLTINMSSNNQVDWTRPNENNAQLVASGIGGSISVNILLDRVADMATMKQWKKNGGGSLPQGTYPVSMDAEQCAGILHRGTEYDLEYLFRVLNGNPQEVILMGDDPKDGLEVRSANMGYITQLPFIFKISERQRYKVIMQGINVSHEMFTRDMVPIRTVVQINLERLPDITSGKFTNFKQAESINLVTPITNAGKEFIPLDRRGIPVKK
jgi:hypothetical protein